MKIFKINVVFGLLLSLFFITETQALRCQNPPNIIASVEINDTNENPNQPNITLKNIRRFEDWKINAQKILDKPLYSEGNIWLDQYKTVTNKYYSALESEKTNNWTEYPTEPPCFPVDNYCPEKNTLKSIFEPNPALVFPLEQLVNKNSSRLVSGDIIIQSGPYIHCQPSIVGIFSADGDIKYLKVSNNTYYNLAFEDLNISIEPGSRLPSCDQTVEYEPCDTSVNWDIGTEKFSLKAGETHEPNNHKISSVKLNQAVVPSTVGGDDFWGMNKSLSYEIIFNNSVKTEKVEKPMTNTLTRAEDKRTTSPNYIRKWFEWLLNLFQIEKNLVELGYSRAVFTADEQNCVNSLIRQKNSVINSRDELESFLDRKNNTACKKFNPPIDFSQETLLVQNLSGVGCKIKFAAPKISLDEVKKTVLVKSKVKERGGCEMLQIGQHWIFIDKISDGYQVVFE